MRMNVTEIYSMEEMIPIVERLSYQYTSGESSSITYERARSLMEAVIYCILHFYEEVDDTSLLSSRVVPAEQAYHLGYKKVVDKVERTQEKYNKLMTHFCYYGNENYRDTVEKALPGFFLYYDVKFAPMEHIITMDYPVFGLNLELCGIDMIEQYLNAIIEEQEYLERFSKEYVVGLLRAFHPRYEKEFFNLREIVDCNTFTPCHSIHRRI